MTRDEYLEFLSQDRPVAETSAIGEKRWIRGDNLPVDEPLKVGDTVRYAGKTVYRSLPSRVTKIDIVKGQIVVAIYVDNRSGCWPGLHLVEVLR